jgi:hypothetical protein
MIGLKKRVLLAVALGVFLAVVQADDELLDPHVFNW